jgi:hypothetical protein
MSKKNSLYIVTLMPSLAVEAQDWSSVGVNEACLVCSSIILHC